MSLEFAVVFGAFSAPGPETAWAITMKILATVPLPVAKSVCVKKQPVAKVPWLIECLV